MFTPSFIVCGLLVMVPGQADDSPAVTDIDNFTALFAESEVRNFVDDVIEANSVPSGNLRSLLEDAGTEVLGKGKHYPLCDKCVEVHTLSVTNFFVQQVRAACRHRLASSLAKAFCKYLEKSISSLDQFFNGYLFHRSRARQLAIATCIEGSKCPAKNAFNSFFNPIIPGRLVDFSKFSYCPYCPYDSFHECSKAVLPLVEKFAVKKVDHICYSKRIKGDFGYGLLTSYVNVFGYVDGYCVRDECKSQQASSGLLKTV